MADVVKDYSLTVMIPGDTEFKELESLFNPIVQQGNKEIADEGIDEQKISLEMSLDMRYFGQSYELSIPFSSGFVEKFHLVHQDLYGYANEGEAVEIVNLRVKAVGHVDKPNIPRLPDAMSEASSHAIINESPVYFTDGKIKTPFYEGEKLNFGNIVDGPAIILRPDTTILIGKNDSAQVDQFGNLIIDIGKNDE